MPTEESQELLDRRLKPMRDSLRAVGLTKSYLAKKLKRELNANKTVFQKLKGAAELPKTPKGRTKKGLYVITKTGLIEFDREGEKEYSTGESLVAINMVDWRTRQTARQDAHKLLDHYPAEKMEHSGKGGGPLQFAISDKDREIFEKLSVSYAEMLKQNESASD